jgi:hypothetical protein
LIRKLQFNLEDASRYRPVHIEAPKLNLSMESERQVTAHREVIYENNPALVQQLDQALLDKKRLERELDKARLDIKDREDECARLRGLVDKLRNGAEKFQADFGIGNMPDQKNMRGYYLSLRGEMIDRIIDMRNRAKNRVVQEMALRLLQLNKDMAKMKRKYEEANVDKMVLAKRASPRDPLYIWTQLRYRITHWLFELFVRSKDESMKFKKYFCDEPEIPSFCLRSTLMKYLTLTAFCS